MRKLLDLTPPGRADERDRSGAAALAPLPLLRSHDRHRDLRGRLPATPPANPALRANQRRYLMSLDSSHTTARFPCCIDRQRVCAAPIRAPVLSLRSRVSPKDGASTAHPNRKRPVQLSQSQELGVLTASAPTAPQSDRHSPVARSLPQLPAGSFPGGFPTTAPVPARWS
jgi:hypothetical protein